ncbi:hypothetical protein RJ639_010242 [Escallonia herrerae]|uniref:Protein kinase domain-containing protein n=1 Tax=Escallonia herrerae TaxID=1293975 RepID=A0AA88VXW1_9ASTE|nr:hypothetical protein RJ639_010242 [Escallonia herrerae]
MSCFSCFSSHEKRASKRFSNRNRGLVPAPSPRREFAPQPRPAYEAPKFSIRIVPNLLVVRGTPCADFHVVGTYNASSSFAENPRRIATEATTNKAVARRVSTEAPNTRVATKETGNNNIAAQTFTFRELATATKNFRPECLVGEGGFGRVYKGRLEKTGQVIAVKQLDRNGLQGNREFLVEVLMLSLLHHQNLVNLIGYCADGDQRLLVYEYMSLGSLEDHLLGQLTVKSDVYSFGVVLLELITGRRAIDTTRRTEEQNLVSWAEPMFKDPSRFAELADPLLGREVPMKSLNQAVAIAAMCLQGDTATRPLISDVVTALSYLWVGPETALASPISAPSPPLESNTSENQASARERQRAVAEAIEWGSNSRHHHLRSLASAGSSA